MRGFSSSITLRQPAAAAAEPTSPPAGDAAARTKGATTTPAPRSSCPAGTVLNGLNYFKGKSDPVALRDEEYPEWLWTCLAAKEKSSDNHDDEGDEFSKSKKERRKAAKKQRELEAHLVATGNLEALAPKIPLQQQSINLPGKEGGSVEDALVAADKRNDLRRAMGRERKNKIREANYLKSM